MLGIKTYAAIGVILALMAAFLYVDRMAYKRGENACAVRIAELERKASQSRDRIESEVMRLSDEELEKELEKWYRD